MSKVYKEVPDNFYKIENFIKKDKAEILDLFFQVDRHLFYDTSSILHHLNATSNEYLLDLFVEKKSIIIITRTVLMELSPGNFCIHPDQIDYFEKIYNKGIPIILMNEEVCIDILKEVIVVTNHEANLLLSYAVKELSRYKTAICNIIKNMPESLRSKILNPGINTEILYQIFFDYARSQKYEGDSLAEELILLIVIILTKAPYGKYIFLSDDLRIRNYLIGVNNYILKHHNVKAPLQLTTSRLIYEMYRKNILIEKTYMSDILSASSSGSVKVFCIGEEDIQLVQKSFTKNDLINEIISYPTFSIAY